MRLSTKEQTKVCTTCKGEKPLTEFRLVTQTRNGRTSSHRLGKCIECVAKYTLEWRRNNPDKVRAYNLRHNKVTGMSVEEYDARLEAQNGVCMICGNPETRMGSGGNPKRLAVDHDHNTGEKRDLLCDDCNNMLGRAHDDPQRLLAAAAYLVRWGR